MKYIKKLLKKINMKILLLILIIIFVSVSFSLYRRNVEKVVNDNTTELLQQIIDEGTDMISVKIDDSFEKMEAMASFAGQYSDIQCDEVLDALSSQSENDLLMFSGVIKPDGHGVTINGETFQADFEDWYFEEALSGERSISEVLKADSYDGEYIILAVPVYQNGNVIGVLQCAYDIDMFTGIIGETTIGRKGTTFIAQEDGTLVSRPEAIGKYTNLYDLLDSFGGDKSKIEKLKKQIQKNESDILTFNRGKYKRYVCYSTIPATDWHAVSVVSASEVEDVTDNITKSALFLSVGITVVFTIYIIYWFIVNYINSRRMHLKEQRYHIVANQSDSIVFECNWSDKTVYHTHKWEKKFGYPPVERDYPDSMVQQHIVYEKDEEKFLNIFKKLEHENSEYEEDYVRIYDINKNLIRCKIRASAIRNRKGGMVRVVGKVLELKDFSKSDEKW